MRLLLDTHLILWTAENSDKLSQPARSLIADSRNEVFFSAVSIWEIAIKRALQCPDFVSNPRSLREGLLRAGYVELTLTAEHGAAIDALPPIHRDPFDRILIAQATVEGLTLLSSDSKVVQYPGPILAV